MKIKFTYRHIKRVIKTEDFLEQLSILYNNKYYLKIVDMGEYENTIFVNNEHIIKIEYTGNDLMYYKIYFDNNLPTTIAKHKLPNNPDFIEVKLIENESLVVLERKDYNYIPLIKGYFNYYEDKTITFDTEKDIDIMCQRLEKLWLKPVINCIDLTNYFYTENVYNGEITFFINNKKYKTNETNVYKTDGNIFVYVPLEEIALILTDNNLR